MVLTIIQAYSITLQLLRKVKIKKMKQNTGCKFQKNISGQFIRSYKRCPTYIHVAKLRPANPYKPFMRSDRNILSEPYV